MISPAENMNHGYLSPGRFQIRMAPIATFKSAHVTAALAIATLSGEPEKVIAGGI